MKTLHSLNEFIAESKTLHQNVNIAEKLIINKDFKFIEVTRIINIFDDNYIKQKPLQTDTVLKFKRPGFTINNENGLENYNIIVDVITKIGTKISSSNNILNKLKKFGAVVGYNNLYNGDVPKYDSFVFAMTSDKTSCKELSGAAIIRISNKMKYVNADIDTIYGTYELISECNNWYKIESKDFKLLLEYLLNKGGDCSSSTLKEFLR